jgi:hypothetical protein
MKKTILFIAAIFFFSIASWSQGILKGKITDSVTTKPLGFATVTVFKAADTAIITYRLSTPDGDFRVPGIPLAVNCRVVISYSGYSIFRKEFTITASQTTLDIGSVSLPPDAKTLDEILVYAERPPVIMKKDTIEFNASAFKTLPNALVEDLLKKLPGVMVDKEGNIVVNGKPVNRILVDGKTFFGDDPKMATRNLPANVIDKVQVTDDKEELMRNGDDNLNNVGKVINITLKKGVKKGWFGKIYAGGGTGELYEAGGIANVYRDTLQVSVLGYMNNLNRTGFSYSELMSAGGFDRIRSNSASNNTSVWNNPGGSGISINGINFGGAQNSGGISTSNGVGFNINHAPNKKQSLYLQYFHGNVNSDRLTNTNLGQYNGDTIISTKTRLTGDFITHTHNFGAGARLKPDSLTNILINVSYLIGLQDEDRFSDIIGNNNKTGDLSNGNVTQFNNANTYYYRHNMSITHLSKTKKGRRYTLNQNLDINNRYNDYMSESYISYYLPSAYDSLYSQLRKERIPRTDLATTFNFSEPLNKHFTIRLGARHEFSKLNNGVSTYNSSIGGKYDVFNTLLSSDFRRISNRGFLGLGLEYKWKDLTITPQVRVLGQHVNNKLISTNTFIKQDQFSVLPIFTIVYKQLSIGYNRGINLPGFNALNPVIDLSNPYFIVRGNPDLLSSKKDNINLNYYFNDAKRYINVGGWMEAGSTRNDIIQSITVDDKGVQTSVPINANGSRNYSMNWNVNKQYKNKQNRIFMWNTGNWMGMNKSKLVFNGIETWQTTFNYNHWFGIGLNLNDKFEWNMNYSFGKNFTKYTSSYFKELKVSQYDWGNEFVLRWPKHIIWETQISYAYNGSIPKGYPRETIRWNGALNLTMLKNEAGVLKLAVNDILDRNQSIWVNANRNTITTTENNILGRYFLATFSYNVRPAGVKRRIGGRERLFNF